MRSFVGKNGINLMLQRIFLFFQKVTNEVVLFCVDHFVNRSSFFELVNSSQIENFSRYGI